MQQSFEEEMKEQNQEESNLMQVEKSKLDSCDLICHQFNKAGKTACKNLSIEVLEDLGISISKEERGTRSHHIKQHLSGDIFLDNAVIVLKALIPDFAVESDALVDKDESSSVSRVYRFSLKTADIESILNDFEYEEKNLKVASPQEVGNAIRTRLLENYVVSSPIAMNEHEFNQAVLVIGKCIRFNPPINNYAISERVLSDDDVKTNCSIYADHLRKGDAISFNPPSLIVLESRLNRIVSEFPFIYPHEQARRARNANKTEDNKTNCTDLMDNMSLQEHCPINFEVILLAAVSYCDTRFSDIKGGNPETELKFKYSLRADTETVHDIIENIRKTIQEGITAEFDFYKKNGRGFFPLTIKGFTIRFSTFPLSEVSSSYL